MRVRHYGVCDYLRTWQAMRDFVAAADDETTEELWLLQHPSVYTLGRAADRRHLLRDNGIPVIHTDRGGQITYHAPGQIIAYLMLNIKRRRLGLRTLVRSLENAVIDLLAEDGITATGNVAAPGVYVDGVKIAALGLRVRHGWTYHGISLNVDMDLTPFADINPCGYEGLQVTQIKSLGGQRTLAEVAQDLAIRLAPPSGGASL